MSDAPDETRPQQRDVDSRSELLPEERAAGSEVADSQAEAVLEESQERTLDPEGTQRASTQTPDKGRRSDDTVP